MDDELVADPKPTETDPAPDEEKIPGSAESFLAFGAEDDTDEPATDTGQDTGEDDEDDDSRGKKKFFTKKKIIIGILCIAILAGGSFFAYRKIQSSKDSDEGYETVMAERRDIVRSIDGSSTIEANDSYNVTALVTGEILTDTFNEGDKVTKDQVLYTIDSSDAQKKVDTAKNSLTKAQQSFADAVKKKSDTIASNALSDASAQSSVDKAMQDLEDAKKKRDDQVATNANTDKTTANTIIKAQESVQTAQRNLESAERKLAEAQEDINDLTVTSDITGKVSEVLVTEGDSVNDGTKIASVYDDSKLKIQSPYNVADAEQISVGDTATVSAASTNDTVTGTVTDVSEATSATSARAVVRYVTIVINNPGGLSAGDKASTSVGSVACNNIATFENYEEGSITAKTSGRISSLDIDENNYVTVGQEVAKLTSDTAEDNLIDAQNSVTEAQTSVNSAKRDLEDAQTKKDQQAIDNSLYSLDSSVTSAERSLDDAYLKLEEQVLADDTYSLDSSITSAALELDNARLSLEEAEEALDDYNVTAPIDGTIVTKNNKAGDKLEQNTSSSSDPMAVIYDMSTLKISLSIDETEIGDVAVDQDVSITADAVEGTFSGKVTKVGVDGTSSNGVTVYPVEVEITDYGDLLPGMNVDCVINVESAENVVAVPVAAIQRGNKVYVKGDKTDESDNAPDGYYSVEVETGATDSQYIEIKSGLDEGTEVCGAAKSTGVEAEGEQESSEQQMQMQGGMGGGMGGGGMPGGGGGGMSGGGGGGMGGGPR